MPSQARAYFEMDLCACKHTYHMHLYVDEYHKNQNHKKEKPHFLESTDFNQRFVQFSSLKYI